MGKNWKNKENKKRSIQCPMLYHTSEGLKCKILKQKCVDKNYNTLCEIWTDYNKNPENTCTMYNMCENDGICRVSAKKCEQEEDDRTLNCYNYQKFVRDVKYRENDKYEKCPSFDNNKCLLKINEEVKECDDKRQNKLCKRYKKFRAERDTMIDTAIKAEKKEVVLTDTISLNEIRKD